ncbi:radical SAM protein [Candidatus Woesearchaeota archaeon]|nr:radical SAM protein [Candidatus Woesearchaeota archaeon]
MKSANNRGKLRILGDSVSHYAKKKLGMSMPIRNLNFAITYDCGFRCQFCNIWKTYLEERDRPLLRQELALEQIQRIFAQLPDLVSVGLTGGETFLRKDIIEVVRSIRSKKINISTNGQFTGKIVESYKQILQMPQFEEVGASISIDGLEQVHNTMRGIKDSYQQAIKTVKLLLELQKQDSRLTIGISNTISKDNINEILKVYAIAKGLGVVFSTRLAQSSAIYYNNISNKIFVDESDIPKLKGIFDVLIKDNPKNLFFRYYRDRYLDHPEKQPIPCFSGFNSFYIDPYGILYPCIMLSQKLGSLKEHTFRELLDMDQAKKIQDGIAKGKCSCWTDCEAINTIYSQPMQLVKAAVHSLR